MVKGKQGMKVAVAMSGGVDSSVAAALMVEAGHEVVGLAMKTHNLEPRHNRACCTPEDMRDARQVAAALDIPFYVLNYADIFAEKIVKPFAESYARGETPNPCIVCNEKIKFVPLLQRAALLGAERLVTGHYAQVGFLPPAAGTAMDDNVARGIGAPRPGQGGMSGPVGLRRGVDERKDQSYFLYKMSAAQLDRVWFPLGGLTKPEVRALAKRFGLSTADKHESQEICFVGDEGYPATVERILGRCMPAGDILHENGEVIGRHEGIHRYTIGQRRGLGIASEEPLFVLQLDVGRNTVRVGPRASLACTSLDLADLHWTAGPPDPAEVLSVQLRYRGQPVPARVVESRLLFEGPVSACAPGQAAVIYRDDWVVGGGRVVAESGQRHQTRPSLPVL